MGDFRDWRPFVYGGLASIIAEFGTFPIDTTKTRLQIQGQQIDPKHEKLRYTGMLDCFVKTSRQEGFKALYCGIWAAVLRQATYGTIKFGTYYSLKEAVIARGWGAGAPGARGAGGTIEERTEHVGWNAACAGVAGALSAALATPTDVLKVRMQMGEALAMGGGGALWRSLAAVARAEGLRGLWRGVTPTAQRAALIAAVELPVYDGVKRRLRPALGDRPANHLASSLLASAASALASTPLDVIRTRLMHQRRVPGSRIYSGTLDCMMQTVKLEGWAALYKGLVPTWLRMGPWNVIFFLTYEQLKLFY